MRVLVLGACGPQGRAVLYDLTRNPDIEEVIAADLDIEGIAGFKRHLNRDAVRFIRADVSGTPLNIFHRGSIT